MDSHRESVRCCPLLPLTCNLYGNSFFWCGGRFIGGPHWPGFLTTVALHLGGTALFIHQQKPPPWAVALVVVLCAFSLSCLFLTGCTDPGTVPKDRDHPEGSARCNQCGMLRPASAHHCYDCDTCTEELDHHCPWTGKCIGKRNMPWFISTTTSCWLLCAWVVLHLLLARWQYLEG